MMGVKKNSVRASLPGFFVNKLIPYYIISPHSNYDDLKLA